MVLDPIPQSLPVHFFGSRPQPPTSRVVLLAHLPGRYGVENPVGVRRLTYLHPSTSPNTHILTFMNTHILTSIHTMLTYLHPLTYLHFHPTHMYIHANTHAHTQTHTHTHTTSFSLFVSHTHFFLLTLHV